MQLSLQIFQLKNLIIIPLLLVSLVCSATKYYVKNGGNDSNTGLDDANAWANHPWMSTWQGVVFLPLVVIALDCKQKKGGLIGFSIARHLLGYDTNGAKVEDAPDPRRPRANAACCCYAAAIYMQALGKAPEALRRRR